MAGQGDYIIFQFTSPKNRSFSFRTYNDEKGQEVGFLVGKDKNGMSIYHRWKFDQDVRKLAVHKEKTDSVGRTAVDFLRKSPQCKDSPNGSYGHDGIQYDYYFEEINNDKSAAKGLEFETLRIDAQNIALNKVKAQEFIDMCAMIGLFDKEESVMRFGLVTYAKEKPQSFMDLYNDPTRKARAIVRQAVNMGLFIKDGPMYVWENKVMGTSEDSVVASLLSDEPLLKAVQKNVEKTKI